MSAVASLKTAARLAPVAAAAALLAACMTMGRPFDAAKVPSLVLGKTTQTEVMAEFGRPFRTGIEDGSATWTYLRYRFSLFGRQDTKDLYIRFNADGTVKSYAYNSSGDGAGSPAD